MKRALVILACAIGLAATGCGKQKTPSPSASAESGERNPLAVVAPKTLLADLKRDGDQRAWLDRMQTRAELYELLDYDGLKAIDRAAAPTGGRAARTKPKR